METSVERFMGFPGSRIGFYLSAELVIQLLRHYYILYDNRNRVLPYYSGELYETTFIIINPGLFRIGQLPYGV